MEVASGIHRVTQGVVNFYVVEEAGAFTLVDAGAPKDWSALERALHELGGAIEDVRAVLLTHAHADHTGFAERARTTSGAVVWVHRDDETTARTGKVGKRDGSILAYVARAEFYRTVFSLARRGGTRIVPIRDVSTFSHGETIAVPGRPRVLHAPGHTPGSCALFFEGPAALVTGDALVTRNPLTGRTGPQVMPSAFNTSTERALASLAALASVPANVVLPGHGEPWTDGVAEAVRAARNAGRS